MNLNNAESTRIKRLFELKEAEACAKMMSASEPWITLRRGYEDSLLHVRDPLKESYVAASHDEILGFTVLNMRGALVGYIHSVCVAPAWRNQGIGTRLMDFAEKRIFTEAPNVFLCTSSFNTQALGLYKNLGYEVIGDLKDYIVPGYSEILMRKSIAPLADFRKKET